MWPCHTHQPLSLGEALRWQMLIAPREQAAFRCSVSSPSASEVPSYLEDVHFLYEKGKLFLFLLSRISNHRVDGSGLLFRLIFTDWVIGALFQLCARLPMSSGLAWLMSM